MRAIRFGTFLLLPALLAGPARAAQPHAAVLPFIQDDYSRALAEARARKVPLFVESWAPW
jgi:hypothetical protein